MKTVNKEVIKESPFSSRLNHQMNQQYIQEIGKKEFGEIPIEIERKTIGICNEVYELKYPTVSYILRMNKEKEWIYGTHKFLPLFQILQIKTPEILSEDYSKTAFPFCYQILNKIEGKDMGLVIDGLTRPELAGIAKEISSILDKFNALPGAPSFGGLTGLNESHSDNYFESLVEKKEDILRRTAKTQVINQEVIDIYDALLDRYRDYFQNKRPTFYYDDLCTKNVMIYEGKFNGLVDLDFLLKGDYLEAIGRMKACWHGQEAGEYYIGEIVKLQHLDQLQQEMVKVYAIFNLIGWTSEAGVQFNANTSSEINWARVEDNRRKILEIYTSIL